MSSPYTIPSFSLIAIVGIVGLFAVHAKRSLNAEKNSLAEITNEATQVNQAISIRKQVLQNMTEASVPVNTFMNAWSAMLAPGRDANSIMSEFGSLGIAHTIAIQGRKPTPNDTTVWQGRQIPMQGAQCTAVSGEFYRLMNWLGAVERAWPLARFETVSIDQNGASLSRTVKVAYPSFIVEKLHQ